MTLFTVEICFQGETIRTDECPPGLLPEGANAHESERKHRRKFLSKHIFLLKAIKTRKLLIPLNDIKPNKVPRD